MCTEEKKPEILVTFLTLGTKQEYVQTFSDWYDFADYLKQRQLRGNETLIRGWEYNHEG
jgi:hypothetical protein